MEQFIRILLLEITTIKIKHCLPFWPFLYDHLLMLIVF